MLSTHTVTFKHGEKIMISNRILIYDPVPFKGGSKKVLQAILTELPSGTDVWVLSNDNASWLGENVHFLPLFSPQCLLHKTDGLLFFLKHLSYLFCLFFHLCKLKRFDKIIGISGPCVDFALYLLSELITLEIIQFVQGNIAKSKVAKFGLLRASKIFYLPSTYSSILATLNDCHIDNLLIKQKLVPFINGVNSALIKQKIPQDKTVFLWAASLLKWKNVELFVEAINQLNSLPKYSKRYFANLCYIKPQTNTDVDISQCKKIANINWYADPNNLNDIRAGSSVFISTSEQEPFGLSILEAMTAGLAIVIPADGAYWDQHLVDNIDCIKYIPGNALSLAQALTRLMSEPTLLQHISQQAKYSAQDYTHENCYSGILNNILN